MECNFKSAKEIIEEMVKNGTLPDYKPEQSQLERCEK